MNERVCGKSAALRVAPYRTRTKEHPKKSSAHTLRTYNAEVTTSALSNPARTPPFLPSLPTRTIVKQTETASVRSVQIIRRFADHLRQSTVSEGRCYKNSENSEFVYFVFLFCVLCHPLPPPRTPPSRFRRPLCAENSCARLHSVCAPVDQQKYKVSIVVSAMSSHRGRVSYRRCRCERHSRWQQEKK